jgi:tRNA-modifying protein YgfZ
MTGFNIDLRGWGQIAVTGEDRKRFLHGMCTSDIEKLPEGGWIRASILSAKGRLMSIVEILDRGDHHLLLTQADLRDPTIEFLDQYAMVDDVEFEPVAHPVHKVWDGPRAVWEAPPMFGAAPEPVASVEKVELLRVEAGFPRYGVDVTDKNFPFETPLDRHIDYQKGCYIGQEPVARVKARGSASKYLRGLRIEGEGGVRVGAPVDHPERAALAQVTSAALSPTYGAIALAMMPRLAWEPGTRVTVDGRPAEVVTLPFGGC